jgi:hypothetical protein
MKPTLRSRLHLLTLTAALVTANAASCFSGGPSPSAGGPGGDDSGVPPGDDGGTGSLPFFPDSPNVYVAKVKNVLVGLPPTDKELQAVVADPSQLGTLVDQWMAMPEYQTKMLRFFELAFQQTQITAVDFTNMLQPGQLQLDQNASTAALMLQNQQEVFARTMVALAGSGQQFNQAMTTQKYMMTTAMRVFYAMTDAWQLDNNVQGIHDYFQLANPTLNLVVTASGPIPLSETLDPKSANYMHWYDPKTASTGCDPLVYPARANTLYDILLGVFEKTGNCTQSTGAGQLTAADFADWRLVNVRQPMSGEPKTEFYDLQSLRGGGDVVLGRPYLGFFTTPAFFANWQTNLSNQMRVTMNQTFIVALGAQVDGTDATQPMVQPPPGLDSMHATDPACQGCHQLLDPSRSILSSTFSFYYGQQIDTPAKDGIFSNQKGMFIFENVQSNVGSIYDLGQVLANHPLVASGWAQKLCYYVDSEACVPSDPEFMRIAKLFHDSSYSWNALVKALVTSPLTTHTTSTLTATTNGEAVAVSRRDHLCAALNARLGFADVCGLDAAQTRVLSANALAIVPGMPSDGYGRGSVAPVLPNNPSLFFRAGTENFCEALAQVVIDNKNPPQGATTWSSAKCSDASCPPITDFVNIVAGLPPSDPRATPLAQALLANFDQSKKQNGITPTEALQSTFIAACMAPSAVAIGL